MTETSEDLVKIREWSDTEGYEKNADGYYEWPQPPEYTEYRVEGKMRGDVLARIGRPADDTCEVHMIQGVIEGGYSEWTVEHDYPIEVWVHDGKQAQKVFDDSSFWEDDSLASFLRWLTDGSA